METKNVEDMNISELLQQRKDNLAKFLEENEDEDISNSIGENNEKIKKLELAEMECIRQYSNDLLSFQKLINSRKFVTQAAQSEIQDREQKIINAYNSDKIIAESTKIILYILKLIIGILLGIIFAIGAIVVFFLFSIIPALIVGAISFGLFAWAASAMEDIDCVRKVSQFEKYASIINNHIVFK